MTTPRQNSILKCIRDHRNRTGTVPSVREIQRACGYASPGGVMRQLANLEQLGLLRRVPGLARSLVPLEADSGIPRELAEVRIYGSIAAGMPADGEQVVDGCIHVDLESLGIPKNARTFALRVRGDSMTGAAILDGDIVILEFKPPSHGRVVAALIDGDTTLKTYVVKNNQPFLRAENPQYPDLIPARELVIQGVMIGLLRRTAAESSQRRR